MQEIDSEITEMVRQLRKQNFKRELIEEKLEKLGYSFPQMATIFKKIDQENEEEQNSKQKRLFIIIALIILAIVFGMAFYVIL